MSCSHLHYLWSFKGFYKTLLALDNSALPASTPCCFLFRQVYHIQGRIEESIEAINSAKDNQSRVLNRAQMEAPDMLTEQQKLAATICAELGQRCVDNRDYEKAIRCYKEAANHDDSDGKV